MTPFERFFAEEFPRMLDHAGIDEYGDEEPQDGLFTAPNLRIQECSWDRKAAYIIWRMRHVPPFSLPEYDAPHSPFEDLL